MTVGLYSVSQFFDPEGRLLRNTPITVTEHGSNTEPDIYTDETGTTTVTEPLLTDGSGNLTFFVDTTNGWWKDLWSGPEKIGPVSVLEIAPRADWVTTDTTQTITAPKTFTEGPVAFRRAGDAFDRLRLTPDALLFGTGAAAPDMTLNRWDGNPTPALHQVALYSDGTTGAGGIVLASGGALGDGNNTWFGFVRDPALNNWGMSDTQAGDLAIAAETSLRHVRIHAGTNWGGGLSQLAVGADGVSANVVLLAEAGLTVVGALALPTGAITSAMILDGTIVNADIAAGAAIAASKLAAIPESGVTGLVADLAARAIDTAVVHKVGDTMTGSLTLTTTGNGALVWTDGSVAGFAASAAAYSTDALVNDVVIRANTGRLLLQRGSGAAAVIVDSAGITAKQTILANAATPIKLPSGTAGQVLTSDASGNLALAAPGAANPNQWTENDQLTGGAVTIPMASGGAQQVTMNANVTGCTVTGAAKGMLLVLRLKQDATGGRTWTWFTNVVWGPRGAPLVPTAANAQATYTFEYDGTNWIEISRTPVDTGWITATLQNAWVAGTGTDGAPAYRRVDETVYIRGNVKSGVLTTTAFTLPAGFQPGVELDKPTTANHAFGDFRILATGAVVPVTGSVTDFFRLTCSFPVG